MPFALNITLTASEILILERIVKDYEFEMDQCPYCLRANGLRHHPGCQFDRAAETFRRIGENGEWHGLVGPGPRPQRAYATLREHHRCAADPDLGIVQ